MKEEQKISRKSSSKNTKTAPAKAKNTTKNREFAVITYMFLGIFICMMGYFVYFMELRSEDVINSPYNKRQDSFAEHVIRGEIKSADGKVLAQTISEDNTTTRYYPYGNMFAHAVGFEGNGKSGIESFANFNLLRSHAFFVEQVFNGIQKEKNPGDNVITTLDYELQELAYNALGSHDGAILVMQPSTGKILAMVSKPDFNPNTISSEWDSIVGDESNSVLLNRVTQGLYPPGSTFKMLTTLQYIHENPKYSDYKYECTGSITVDDTTINCYQGAKHGQVNLKSAFAKSCNTAFVNLGLSLKQDNFSALCDSLLFQKTLPAADYPIAKSSYVLSNSASNNQIMQTVIGQGETLMTPLHVTLLSCAIANNGELMNPYVIDHTENHKGITVKNYKPTSYGTLFDEKDVASLQEFMEYVVSDGTGSKLQGGNYKAAGKTGSAEYSNIKGQSHAWFSGYAKNEEKGDLALTVLVEGGGAGSETAVPIAKQIFDQYFN
jgi:peptidoglycan glycosyltransferase